MRIIFMGTPDFAVAALSALAEAGHDIACAFSQPPRPAGRGHRERRSPVHEAAAALDIPVRTPRSLKDPAEQAAFAGLDAEVAVVAAYGLILPKPILDAPTRGCLNIHASLLPRWRGAAPIQRAILAGDTETGVTIMQMDDGLDTGAMLMTRAAPIGPETTGGQLHDTLAALGANLIVAALAGLAEGSLTPVPQPDEGVTYAPKLDKAEARIDWTRPAAEIERMVRAFDPWPGAWFVANGQRIRLLAAEVAAEVAGGSGAPGTVLDARLTIACGDGALRPLRLQRQGKEAVDTDAFQRGFPLAKGSRVNGAVDEEVA